MTKNSEIQRRSFVSTLSSRVAACSEYIAITLLDIQWLITPTPFTVLVVTFIVASDFQTFMDRLKRSRMSSPTVSCESGLCSRTHALLNKFLTVSTHSGLRIVVVEGGFGGNEMKRSYLIQEFRFHCSNILESCPCLLQCVGSDYDFVCADDSAI